MFFSPTRSPIGASFLQVPSSPAPDRAVPSRWLPIVVAVLLMTAATQAIAANPTGDFILREQLGSDWRNERVTFPLSSAQASMAKAGAALLGPDGKPVPSQIFQAEKDGAPHICFQADLAPYATAAFRLSENPAVAKGDLEIDESDELITITNGMFGLKIRRKLAANAGPIAGVRLHSGNWTGDSTLAAAPAIGRYEARVLARGPVFAEVACRAEFADGGRWTIRFVVEAAEPVVLVSESFDAPGGGILTLLLGDKGFRPTHMLHRNSDVGNAAVVSDPIAGYHLEPWLRWNNPRHGTWVALHSPPPAASADMLAIGLLKPSLWVDPTWQGRASQPSPHAKVAIRDGLAAVDLPLGGGRREWMLAAIDQADSVAAVGKRVAPPPQKLVIKHGDFPLDEVKDFVLDWKGDDDNHPVLYISKQDLPALKSRLKSDPKELARWSGRQPIDKGSLDGPVREFIASGDPQLGRLMAAKAEVYLQTCVDWFLKQDDKLTPGAAPHMQSLIFSVVNLIDPVLSTEAFTPEARKRALAKLAFLGYVVSSPDYSSTKRRFTAFANMTSVVAMYRTALGCMLPSHPQSKAWVEQGLNQLIWQLTAWSDEDGGWIEAPHYAMVSFDHLIAGFAMAKNAGYSDRIYDPRMRKVIEWFALISTPRDTRTGGWRHQPPIGNTYPGEPNGIYGIAAALWKDKDPEFAARMQWLFEQHGSTPALGSGWDFPVMAGYRFLMNASGVQPKPAADFGSAYFRKTGVVLRNTMDTDRETYLHLIAGSNHDHYDYDSGSIVIYGKGRILCDDWGYHGRHAVKWHSMLTGSAAGGGIMKIAKFAPSAAFDYVAGSKDAWARQIGFAKDAEPLGPSFFLIRDSYAAGDEATWRLWLTTGISAGAGKQMPDAAKPAGGPAPGTVALTDFGAALSGIEDVDLDVFLYEPAKLGLALEPAKLSHRTGNWMGNIGPVEYSQTALTAKPKGPGVVAALLYPRLKTESPPQVDWSADGQVAQVRSKAGTDYVFIASPPPLPQVGDGTTLEPLRDSQPQATAGVRTIAMAGDPLLNLVVNASESAFKSDTLEIPSGSISLHPGPNNPVTAVWQSPITGTVTIEAKLRDGDTRGGDGILYALRHGPQALAEGAMDNGGPEVIVKEKKVAVAKGDFVRLVILPGQTNPKQSNWWDTTIVEFIVKDEAGTTWDLRQFLVDGETLGNGLDRDFDKAVWWVCSGDAEAIAFKAIVRENLETHTSPDGKVAFQGTAGSVRVRGNKTTLTLGAAGSIKAGGKELTADGPATKD